MINVNRASADGKTMETWTFSSMFQEDGGIVDYVTFLYYAKYERETHNTWLRVAFVKPGGLSEVPVSVASEALQLACDEVRDRIELMETRIKHANIIL